MTTQQPEALNLADWLEAVGGGPSAKRCTALLREQHTRIAELEAQIEALSGVQALSAAPEGWRELAAKVMDALADAQDTTNSQYPEYVRCYPSWERHARWLRWHAYMFRSGNPVGNGAGNPAVLAALAASPTPPAEQQAAPKAAPGDAIDEAMRERDDAEDFIDALLDEVLGHERPEWSNLYGRADALNDVQERMTSLHKPAVDKAWGQFQSAKAAPQQEAQDATVAAFEAVRKKLCTLPRYSFVLDDDGLVRRAPDRTGNWIEFDEAHALFDPVAVDAAIAAQGGQDMTDDTQPEAREFTMSQYASKDDMIGAMRKRVAELESELEAVGAGGVQALSAAPAGFVPVAAFDRLHAHAESLAARLLAASPTPPAEQAASKAAPGEPMASAAKSAIMGAAYDFRDAHISGSMNLKRSAHAALKDAVDNALAAQSAPQPAPAPLSEMPYEKRKAIQEGEQIGASDAWFHARHNMLDTLDRRNVFRAGFDRGWNAALAAQGGKV